MNVPNLFGSFAFSVSSAMQLPTLYPKEVLLRSPEGPGLNRLAGGEVFPEGTLFRLQVWPGGVLQ